MAKAPADASYALPVATNPYVSANVDSEPGGEFTGDETRCAITHPEAVLWAQLHNLRYRMLLALLEHSFHERGGAATNRGATRGMLINAAFGEMYNLRAISDLLMRLPLSADGGTLCAAPPFQMPYKLQLSSFSADRWQGHLDVLEAAGALMQQLEPVTSESGKRYLRTSLDTDAQVKAVIVKVLDAHREAA